MSSIALNLTGLPGLPLGELFEGDEVGVVIVGGDSRSGGGSVVLEPSVALARGPLPPTLGGDAMSEVPSGNALAARPVSEEFFDDEDLSDVIAKIDPATFFFQAKTFIVTYATWIDKETMINWFKTTHKAKIVRVAHELGTKKIGYEHTHVFVDFGKFIQRTDPRCFDYGAIHPNIGPIRFQKHLNRIYKYMCKYDHENDDMLALIKREWTADDVWQCRTVQEALRNVSKASEVPAVIQTFALKPRLEEYQPKEWIFPWQQVWHDKIIHGAGDYRSITWIHERIGGTGKSFFTKEMFMRYPKEVYSLKSMGGAEKCATIIANALDGGWSGRCLIVDLPRNAEDKSIYEPLESIRDGMVTATRYSGRTFVFEIKWVIVFANFPPQTFSMSMDRWKIHDYNDMNRENEILDAERRVDVKMQEDREMHLEERKKKREEWIALQEQLEAYRKLAVTIDELVEKTGDTKYYEMEEYKTAMQALENAYFEESEESDLDEDESIFQTLSGNSAVHALSDMQAKKSRRL